MLKKHTLSQAICGGVQGFFLTVLEMYLYMYLLNRPITGIVSLEMSCLYILAIIATPVILGILSYTNQSRTLFAILEIVLIVMFFALTPLNVFIVFVVITLTSVLISLYAGRDFIWYNVVK